MKIVLFLSFMLLLKLQAEEYASLLFHGNCTTCHFESKSVSAPSVIMIREKYLSAFPEKEDFVAYMSSWVQHPDERTSIMLEAVEEYELMPELAFDLETLRTISAYIYETDFGKKHSDHE